MRDEITIGMDTVVKAKKAKKERLPDPDPQVITVTCSRCGAEQETAQSVGRSLETGEEELVDFVEGDKIECTECGETTPLAKGPAEGAHSREAALDVEEDE